MKEYAAWKSIFQKSPDAASVHPNHAQFLNYYEKNDKNEELEVQDKNKKFFGLF